MGAIPSPPGFEWRKPQGAGLSENRLAGLIITLNRRSAVTVSFVASGCQQFRRLYCESGQFRAADGFCHSHESLTLCARSMFRRISFKQIEGLVPAAFLPVINSG